MDDLTGTPPPPGFDEALNSLAPQGAMPPGMDAPPEGFDDALEDLKQEKYGTLGQQAIAGIEGIAKGVAGPLATGAERLLGVDPEDIRGREEANPITHGVGEAVGLVGSTVAGVGAGSVMAKAGSLAVKGLEAGEGASLLYKVGTEAVKQAAEMAVYQSGDEVSKMILKDPEQSFGTAVTNVGLASVLGAAGGAFMEGAVNPLWKATAGPQVEKMMQAITKHSEGKAGVKLPAHIAEAAEILGMDLEPLMKASVSGDKRVQEVFNTLAYAQNPKLFEAVEKMHVDAANKVMEGLGVPLKELQEYSHNEAGKDLRTAFLKEFEEKYAPRAAEMQARNARNAVISVPDEARLTSYNNVIERGIREFGTDSPVFKLYDDWAERILAKDTVGQLDSLKTELRGEINKAFRSGDDNAVKALRDIRSSITDLQEAEIMNAAKTADKAAEAATRVEGLPRVNVGEIDSKIPVAKSMINANAEANRNYAQFARTMDDLLDHVGAGSWGGAEKLINKLEGVAPETLLKKFSPKGNADFIPFLQQHFPETFAHVQKNELKDLLKSAVNQAKGEMPININKLDDIISKKMQGSKELIDFAVSPEALKRLEAAKALIDALPTRRDSGTPGGLMKVLKDMPRSALGGIAGVFGHNPITGALLGELSHKLGRDAPDAVRLAYLKFLGSDQPIKSEAMKAMVDYMKATYKGENLTARAVKGIFKGSAQVLAANAMPEAKDTKKLDKIVDNYRKNPDMLLEHQGKSQVGHYLPDHQSAIAESSTRALEYLKGLKPEPHKVSPLGREIEPTPGQEARYQRALTIAQQPLTVLQHVKDGTLKASDVQDLKAMYPGFYNALASKLSDQMIHHTSDDEPIPYNTRVGLSLFLGQPLDGSMSPQGIMAAQPKPVLIPQQPKGSAHRKMPVTAMKKTASMYQTPDQAASANRAKRD